MPSILVVDDEQSICWGLTRLGESLGHEVRAASSAEQALTRAKQRRPDVIVLDVRLPGMDGLSAIERFQESCGSVPIIVITAYGDLETAVDAVRRGAFDYIAKPFDVSKVKGALVRALASRPAVEDEDKIPAPAHRVEGMVGRSLAIQEVYKQIALAAASDAAVLLIGESGTGKELAARAIHRYSSRANGPFIAANVASLSPMLADSELFGHARGALAGDDGARVGLMTQAIGGTLYLDEITDIPPSTQVKLLRALEHGEFVPVGGVEPIRTSFRVIAASRRDLARHIEDGFLRHALLVRLSTFQIHLPPLRERAEDIAELAEYFTQTLARGPGSPRGVLSPEAFVELKRRPWRGNVRELRHAIDHALLMARGRAIMPEHLPPPVKSGIATGPHAGADGAVAAAVHEWAEQNIHLAELAGHVYDRLLNIIEPPLLEVAIKNHKGQCATAARTLGIHRTTLRKKLDEHGIDSDAE